MKTYYVNHIELNAQIKYGNHTTLDAKSKYGKHTILNDISKNGNHTTLKFVHVWKSYSIEWLFGNFYCIKC